ncbi:SMI1/KNR4 family protein [Microbacterium sp. MM2322]|uniref:SMI1/KNR4 family protein n=1 Tax=Microbacterium sp. MM2322 TaxID=3157631 RepID=UPI003D803D8E
MSGVDDLPTWADLPWFSEDWEGSALPVGAEDLDELEQLVGCALPRAFRAFYLRHNGGWPLAESGMLHGFTAVKHGALPIERLWADLRQGGGDAFDEWMPFAHDPGGNLFCFTSAANPREPCGSTSAAKTGGCQLRTLSNSCCVWCLGTADEHPRTPLPTRPGRSRPGVSAPQSRS